MNYLPKANPHTLYDPRYEQDACGVGFLARPSSTPSHDIVEMALDAVAEALSCPNSVTWADFSEVNKGSRQC